MWCGVLVVVRLVLPHCVLWCVGGCETCSTSLCGVLVVLRLVLPHCVVWCVGGCETCSTSLCGVVCWWL